MILHPSASFVAPHALRGMALIESLFAFIALAGSALAIGHLQTQLRLDADVARDRSQAVRLGEAELEDLRAWSVIDAASAARSYAGIVDADRAVSSGAGFASSTTYRIARRIDDAAFAELKTAGVDVGWTDRAGRSQHAMLSSVIGGAAPAYASGLALGAGAIPAATRGAFGRAPGVPVDAVNIGNGRSARKTAASATTALLYDNATGDVVAHCSDVAATRATRELTAADVTHCTFARQLAVGGTIRFTSASPPSPTDASDPPLPMSVALTLEGSDASAAPSCEASSMKSVRYLVGRGSHVDAVPIDATPSSLGLATWDETGDRFIEWQCLVEPRADGHWSGRVSLVAPAGTIGSTSSAHRVCRFSTDADGSGAVDANQEHPRDYRDVGSALLAQNFLVVRGSDACPASQGLVQHQP